MRAIWVLLWLSSVAAAEPVAGAVEGALRIGAQTNSTSVNAADGGDGTGLYLDGELGWHVTHRLSLVGFVAYSSTFYHSWSCDCSPDEIDRWTAHTNVFDAGARLRVRVGDVLLGAGLGIELVDVHWRGTCTAQCDPATPPMPFTTSAGGQVAELHLGYVFPRIDALGGGAIQLIAYATIAANGDFLAASARGAVGVAWF